jgi:hypothetical protein
MNGNRVVLVLIFRATERFPCGPGTRSPQPRRFIGGRSHAGHSNIRPMRVGGGAGTARRKDPAPLATNPPKTAAPMEKSMTQPGTSATAQNAQPASGLRDSAGDRRAAV